MDNMVITAVLMLLSGIGVFLVACNMMSSNLESLSSSKLRGLFAKNSDKKAFGVVIGATTTAAIQSSGATTVMIIGFVNAGILSLSLAATMIYGANIGTTITAQIVALGLFGQDTISMSLIFASLAGIGAFFSIFAKSDRNKKIAGILTGFGLIFVGLTLMSDSMVDFAQMDDVKNFLASIDNIILLLIVGILLTALVQSSSVVTSVAITMVVTGLIDLEQGIYLTLGSNVGSCIVAILAGFSSGTNAKRTALIHLFFNITGVLVFVIAGYIIVAAGGPSYSALFEWAFPGAPQIQLAMFHTFFNVVGVLIMLPLTGKLVSLVTRLVPDNDKENKNIMEPRVFYIDRYMLKTPSLAIQQLKKEIKNMMKIAKENYDLSCDMIATKDISEKTRFEYNEKELNYLNKELVSFLVGLSDTELTEKDSLFVSTTYHVLTDLERVGDYAENILEYTERFIEHNASFSEDAINSVYELKKLITQLYEYVYEAYDKRDYEVLKKAFEVEEEIDVATKRMVQEHIDRLNNNKCKSEAAPEYLLFVSNSERVADHFMNVGGTIKKILKIDEYSKITPQQSNDVNVSNNQS